MAIQSDTMVSFNLGAMIFCCLICLVIFILATVAAFQYDYEHDHLQSYLRDEYGDVICSDVRRLSLENQEMFKDLEVSPSTRQLAGCNWDIDKEFFKNINKGKKLNRAGFGLVLADGVVRMVTIFLLCCCGTKRTNRMIGNYLVFLSLAIVIAYMVCFGIAFDKFKKAEKRTKSGSEVEKFAKKHPEYLVKGFKLKDKPLRLTELKAILEDSDDDGNKYFTSGSPIDSDKKNTLKKDTTLRNEIADALRQMYNIAKDENHAKTHWDRFRKQVKKTKKLLIGIIVLYCICFPLLLVTVIVALACGGLAITDDDKDNDF